MFEAAKKLATAMMPTLALLKTCLRVSLGSLLFGTALLGLFFFSNDLLVAFVSVPVVLGLGLYNLKLLVQLLWRGQLERASRRVIWRTAAIMTLNLPVALLYTKAVLVLNNTLLVRLVNTTGQPLQRVVVLGCGGQRPLADLQAGQATILWLPIAPDCFERTVSVQYAVGAARQQALIDGYVVEGKRLTVQLGNNQQGAVTNR